MSSITPPSFVDDGSSFEKRIHHGLHPAHISNWIRSFDSDTTSAYTGSYIDDGADMLVPSRRAPGFGPIDPKFYKQRKRRENEERGAWNDDVQKAVAGDIGRSLEKMRGIGGVEVKRTHGGEARVKDKKKDTVTIPLPPKWGTIVIKANDGRVVVVDEDGEFDSGPTGQEQVDAEVKWVKAPSTIDLPPPPPAPKRDTRTKEKKKHNPVKSLTPIQESDEYEDIYDPSGGEDPMSPTGFFMTGGASGWPSPVPSCIASPRNSGKQSSSVKKSPVRSLPGSWPSPPHSPTKYSDTSTSSEVSWGKKSSHNGGKSRRSSRHDGDNMSTKTYSTYKPPVVEDAPDTSSDRILLAKDGECGRIQKGSVEEWGDGQKGGVGWGGSTKSSKHSATPAFIPDPFPTTAPTAIQNWVAKTVSETSSRKSRSRTHRSRAPSESSWDGFEKAKSMSEISVAGTEGERDWGDSQPSRKSKGSEHRSHGSSRRGCQVGWGGSEQDWGASQTANVEVWDGKSEGGGGYANGYGEDNSTYLNDNWSGVKVRVRSTRGSTRGSAGGWE
jgi:hypothetical protein